MRQCNILIGSVDEMRTALTINLDGKDWVNAGSYYSFNRSLSSIRLVKDTTNANNTDLSFTSGSTPAALTINTVSDGYRENIGNNVTQTPFDGYQLVISRNSKPKQALFLSQFEAFLKQSKKESLVRFRQPMTWLDCDDYRDHGEGKLIILRPQLGARSIGLIVFDPSVTTIYSMLEILDKYRHQPTPDAERYSKEKIDSFNLEIRDKFKSLPGYPAWRSDDDRYIGEGVNQLLNGGFAQEYVPNVNKEYRVIVGGSNKPVYCIERKRTVYDELKDVKLAYGRGKDVGVHGSFKSLEEAGLPKTVISEFNYLLKFADFSLFAFDIYTTDDGKWGIFEFSPEFGMASVPNGLIRSEARLYIQSLFEKYNINNSKYDFFKHEIIPDAPKVNHHAV